MRQGLSGGPGTYTKLKDVATGPIPEPLPEPPLEEAVKDCWFAFFVDDDIIGGKDFDTVMALRRSLPRRSASLATAEYRIISDLEKTR